MTTKSEDKTEQEEQPYNIGILLYHLCDELELISIYNGIRKKLSDTSNVQCFLLAKSRNSVLTQHGVMITPDWGFMSAPPCNILIIPGGLVDDYAMRDKVMLEYLKRNSDTLEVLVGCSEGALVLGAAEYLGGLKATASESEQPRLHEYNVADVVPQGIVQNEQVSPNIWYASGELVGIEVAKAVIEKLEFLKI